MSVNPNVWPVDGHVHLHDLELVAPMLDAAAGNFRAVTGNSRAFGVLLLTQAARETVFERLQSVTRVGDWRISPCVEESVSLIADRQDLSLAIVCGRQLRAEDGLEVHALGTCATFSDGLGFAESVDAVRATDALAVIPWGVGKWLGRRGSRVKSVMQSRSVRELFVGDNGGRLALLGEPPTLRGFRRLGFRVLPGTDPFPLQRDLGRVGSFGFLADVGPATSSPWRRLRTWLLSRPESPPPYGAALNPATFVYNQAGLRLRNFRAGRTGALA
jgi:hypothetical protein